MTATCDPALLPFRTLQDIRRAETFTFDSLSPSALPPLFKNGLMRLRWQETLRLLKSVPQVLHMGFSVVIPRGHFAVVDWLAYGELFPFWTVEGFLDSRDELVLAVCPFERGEVPAGHPFACLRCTVEPPPPFALPPWLRVADLCAAAERRRDSALAGASGATSQPGAALGGPVEAHAASEPCADGKAKLKRGSKGGKRHGRWKYKQ